MTSMSSRTRLVLGLALVAGACVKNPATGERQLVLVSEGKANSMGEQSAKQIAASVGVVDDPKVTAYVDRVARELAAKSEMPDATWSFQVLDDPTVNAFA